ncbi:glutaredoxin-like protein [groundwater metagenome]
MRKSIRPRLYTLSTEMMKVSGGFGFPTIVVGKKVIVGFYEDKLREVLGL